MLPWWLRQRVGIASAAGAFHIFVEAGDPILEQQEGGFAITASRLSLKASIAGVDDARFQELAAAAKANCPVSKLLKAEISLDAELL